MKVIQAIIEKAASPSILANYQDPLKALSDNFITNISYDQISSLVKMMQSDGFSWNIQTVSAKQGEGRRHDAPHSRLRGGAVGHAAGLRLRKHHPSRPSPR